MWSRDFLLTVDTAVGNKKLGDITRQLRSLSRSGAFLRRAVISIGHGAALHLRRDAPVHSFVELKRDIFI